MNSHRATGHSPPPELPHWNHRTQSKRPGNTTQRSDEDVTSHPCRKQQLLLPCLATPLLVAPRTVRSQSPGSSPQSSDLSLEMSFTLLPPTALLLPKPCTPAGKPPSKVALATCPPPRTGSSSTCSKQIHKFFKDLLSLTALCSPALIHKHLWKAHFPRQHTGAH